MWLYNLSLQCADVQFFPERCKIALVSPIPKNSDLHDINSYKPVSALNRIANISGKLNHDYLYKTLNSVID